MTGACTATCGDGVKADGEACDDANTAADDGCSATCEIEAGWSCAGSPSVCSTGCGDGIVAGMEACDDGNTASGDGCSQACAVESGFGCTGAPSVCVTTCGDGITAGTEACDDGNETSADGCSDTCEVESGYACTGTPSICVTTCGDGVLAGTETCDDGNDTAADGCSDTCAVEDGYTCNGAPSVCATTCGDGVTAGTETCDDGNADAADGCSDTCAVENGYTCNGAPSVCATTCGDGVTAGLELCDDGNTAPGDGCSDTCAQESGYTCAGAPSVCSTTCGDGVIAGLEACDDGGSQPNDGCSDTCTVEQGYACTGSPSVCATVCGDGVLAGAESCDDGNTSANDGCSATCAQESGFTCSGAPSVCVTTCGDGVRAGSEACDDGNVVPNDGCSATCTVEPGYACTGSPSTCATVCGDGVVAGAEACDDGNTSANDGCSATCTVQSGYTCSGAPSACVTTCGDGIQAGAESCDDGNVLPNDGCDATCAVEAGYTCTGAPSACAAKMTCPTGSSFVAVRATDLPKPFTTPTSAQSNVAITASGLITAVGVGVNIDHDYASDVDLSLVAPSGAIIDLSSDNGGSSDDFLGTWFLDSAATSITAGSPPFTGDFRPEQPFSSLTGIPASGTWTLSAVDDDAGIDGVLNEFVLMVCVCTTCEIGAHCGDGLDNDSDGQTDCQDSGCQGVLGCATCGNGIIEAGEACDDLNTTSNDGCSSTCSIELAWACTGEPSACTPKMACDPGSTLLAFEATDLPKPVTDTSPASSVIAVGAPGLITSAGVGFTIQHTYDGDLDISLVGPGATLDLTSDNGAGGDNYTGTWLLDSAATAVTSGAAPFTGDYRPETPFSTLYGAVAAGNWTLNVVDDASGDNGTVSEFILMLCVCTTCEIGAHCGDGLDNDGDGQTDCADPGCGTTVACNTCGNGYVVGTEQCDDGNTTAGDGCGATCELELGFKCTGQPSACGPRLSCSSGSTFQVFASTDVPKAVTNTAAGVSTLALTGAGVVTRAGVGFSVTHTNDADLDISLVGSSGATIDLTSDNGSTGDNYTQTWLLDGATPVNSGSAPFTGEFQPEQPLATFIGSSVAGNWTLNVADDSSSNDGTLTDYALMLCVCTTCEIGDACGDGLDNDGDGQTDCADASCNGTLACNVCGDGIAAAPETCDDGNTTGGDGCSATCQVEITAESEPNDTPALADASALQLTGSAMISGSITEGSDELDVYRLTVTSPAVVRLETFGATPFACPSSSFATVIRLLDAAGTQLVSDTVAGISSCSALILNLAPGTYYVSVEESGTNASLANYHLQVTFEMNAGVETEPNDTRPTANPFGGTDAYVSGDHQVATDEDWYAIDLQTSSSIRAEIIEGSSAETCESNGIASELTLFNANGVQLVTDTTDGRGNCSRIDGTGGTSAVDSGARALLPGRYYFRVRASSSATGANAQFDYRLVTTIRP